MLNSRILVIPDLHCPYNHPDAYAFLAALKKKYQPTRVICLGDETDGHKISYHESDPDLMSAGHELISAIGALEPLYRLFPVVDVMHSNHGSLVFRKGKTSGLPEHVFKSYNGIFEAPEGWQWQKDLVLKLPNGQFCFFFHGKLANALGVSQRLGMSTVNGHFHSQFSIQTWSSPIAQHFAMVSGCLINPKSRAFQYNQNDILRPILGASVIIDSHPRLEPMLLDNRGHWTGKMFG